MRLPVLYFIFLLLAFGTIKGQDSTSDAFSGDTDYSKTALNGFIRGGFYSWTNKNDDNLYVSSAFSDFALKLQTSNGNVFRAYADVRFRYGSEFLTPVSRIEIREGFASVSGKKWDFSAGQKIVKWGRCDFTNPASKLSALDMISRSPDREDMDMGNLLAEFKWFPFNTISFQAVVVPYYRSSKLIIDPVPLPDYITVNQIKSLITDKKMFSYGLKTNLHFPGFDGSLSWFEGYDPMPGIMLANFNASLSSPSPSVSAELEMKPYKTRMVGIDFEATAGRAGIRGEAAWSDPVLSYNTYEYVPLPEIKWVAGIDWSAGKWRFTGEYNGKYIIYFQPAIVEPMITSEPDFSQLSSLLSIPGFDLHEYVRNQVGSFNRLYNYQMKETYHSAGLRIEAELSYGKILPSLFSMYNFTSRDLLIIPELKIKPSDGLTVTGGAEIYSGVKSSLYDLVNDFMNSFYVSLRVDF